MLLRYIYLMGGGIGTVHTIYKCNIPVIYVYDSTYLLMT